MTSYDQPPRAAPARCIDFAALIDHEYAQHANTTISNTSANGITTAKLEAQRDQFEFGQPIGQLAWVSDSGAERGGAVKQQNSTATFPSIDGASWTKYESDLQWGVATLSQEDLPPTFNSQVLFGHRDISSQGIAPHNTAVYLSHYGPFVAEAHVYEQATPLTQQELSYPAHGVYADSPVLNNAGVGLAQHMQQAPWAVNHQLGTLSLTSGQAYTPNDEAALPRPFRDKTVASASAATMFRRYSPRAAEMPAASSTADGELSYTELEKAAHGQLPRASSHKQNLQQRELQATSKVPGIDRFRLRRKLIEQCWPSELSAKQIRAAENGLSTRCGVVIRAGEWGKLIKLQQGAIEQFATKTKVGDTTACACPLCDRSFRGSRRCIGHINETHLMIRCPCYCNRKGCRKFYRNYETLFKHLKKVAARKQGGEA